MYCRLIMYTGTLSLYSLSLQCLFLCCLCIAVLLKLYSVRVLLCELLGEAKSHYRALRKVT